MTSPFPIINGVSALAWAWHRSRTLRIVFLEFIIAPRIFLWNTPGVPHPDFIISLYIIARHDEALCTFHNEWLTVCWSPLIAANQPKLTHTCYFWLLLDQEQVFSWLFIWNKLCLFMKLENEPAIHPLAFLKSNWMYWTRTIKYSTMNAISSGVWYKDVTQGTIHHEVCIFCTQCERTCL